MPYSAASLDTMSHFRLFPVYYPFISVYPGRPFIPFIPATLSVVVGHRKQVNGGTQVTGATGIFADFSRDFYLTIVVAAL